MSHAICVSSPGSDIEVVVVVRGVEIEAQPAVEQTFRRHDWLGVGAPFGASQAEAAEDAVELLGDHDRFAGVETVGPGLDVVYVKANLGARYGCALEGVGDLRHPFDQPERVDGVVAGIQAR